MPKNIFQTSTKKHSENMKNRLKSTPWSKLGHMALHYAVIPFKNGTYVK
jgi:hypothetical protein